MERNNRNDYNEYRDRYRERDTRGGYRNNSQPVDKDSYRGAYRFDNSSNHHNVSTWDWHPEAERRRRENDYNRNYNRDYNQNYNRDYNRAGQGNHGYDHDNYNRDSRYRDQDSRYGSSNTANWNRSHRDVHDRIQDHDPYGAENFNANYGPDHYGQGGGPNYGNEAGSLSYGYDGSSNYDPDWNTQYDPLSGERRSYHGFYTSRHPDSDRQNRNNRI